jgi:hypothetical protein
MDLLEGGSIGTVTSQSPRRTLRAPKRFGALRTSEGYDMHTLYFHAPKANCVHFVGTSPDMMEIRGNFGARNDYFT